MFVCHFNVCSQNSIKEEEKKDDVIHIGNSIMTFYAALIDLLGRCAPEKHVSSQQPPSPPSQKHIHALKIGILTETCLFQLIHAGKGEAIRIKAILRSLVPVEDLVGVISIPFFIPSLKKGNIYLPPPASLNSCL